MHHFSVMNIFLLLLGLMLPLLSYIKRIKNTGKSNLPPSPLRLPILGNLHLVGSSPHRSLRALSNKHGPLMLLQLGRVPLLVISSPEMAQEALKTHDLTFSDKHPSKIPEIVYRGSGSMAFSPYGEYWRQARKLCVTHLLSSRMVQSFQRVRQEEVELMVAKISQACRLSSPTLDMSDVLNSFSSNVVSRAVSYEFFKEEARKRALRELGRESAEVIVGLNVSEFFPQMEWVFRILGLDAGKRAEGIAKKWNLILDEVIQRYTGTSLTQNDASDKVSDFVDILLSIENEADTYFPFTRDKIKALLIDMFAGGIDTSSTVLEWSMAELVRSPTAMEKLQEEVRGAVRGKEAVREEDVSKMSYIKAVIKEAMRLHPPVPLMPRASREDCRLGGYDIPKGTRVVVNAWAIGRDPNMWEEPEEFKPERFVTSSVDNRGNDFHYIPFGAGRRSCPGYSFAVPNVELALANLVNRFDWKLPGDMRREDLDMNESPGLTAHRKVKLELAVQPRTF